MEEEGKKMAEENEKQKAPLSLSKGTLELKKPLDASKARTGAAPARNKTVTVEIRKKRVFNLDNQAASRSNEKEVELDKEQAFKLKVLQDAKKQEEENRVRMEEERKKQEEEEKILSAKREEERKAQEKLEKEKQTNEAVSVKDEVASVVAPVAEETKNDKFKKTKDFSTEEDSDNSLRGKFKEGKIEIPRYAKRRVPGEERRRGGKINVQEALSDSGEEGGRMIRGRSLASIKRAREKERLKSIEASKNVEKVIREVIIPDTITVQELANRMAERAATLIKILMNLGVMATITQTIDADTAQLIVEELGHKFKRVSDSDVEDMALNTEDREEDLVSRPPVVTVMGHVDHGKTSLLDAFRESNVVDKEAGGITQHIGAYQIQMAGGQKVTFIDTPGHAAFTSMRARGAQITDVVILVVAANDGVMPQTIEAISHAKDAGVPLVVAINKIDVPGANPMQVRHELLNYSIVPEELGGDVLTAEVSAKKRMNLEKLIESVLLQAEILDLKANPNRLAEGVAIESKMEKGRGPVATILIQKGTLKVGDAFICGKEWGKVRALIDEHGKRLDNATPSQPVEVLGFESTPMAGDMFVVVESENKAREISNYRYRKERESKQVISAKSLTEQMFDKIQAGEVKELPVLIKSDVQGSAEALVGTLSKIKSDQAKIKVVYSGVGGINESDITLANASKAIVIGFNVRANSQARDMAKHDGIDVRYYSIIYDVADEMKNILEGMLKPILKEKIIGYTSVRQVFNITKVGKVAGCMVTEGMVKRNAKARILRDNTVIYQGDISQLKRVKDDVKEAREGMECGISFDKYDDIKVGDVIECYEIEETAAKLEIKED